MNNTVCNKISISSWNVHGLADKIDDDFFTKKIKSDIIILLETWKRDSKETQVSGYQVTFPFQKLEKRIKKAKRHSGGILIYINKNIAKGVSCEKNRSSSKNRAWLKLDKTFFGLV